ncbi:MAG: MarR family transcriptional regulator [candidate division WOR-3 bacterium]
MGDIARGLSTITGVKWETQRRITETLGRRDGAVLIAIINMGSVSNEEIARATGYSVRSVQRAMKSLVSAGYVARGISGPRRRLVPGERLISERRFVFTDKDLSDLYRTYGQERVDEAIRVLEYTYALSKTEPRCPLAILKAVLRRGDLRYPVGYVRQDRVSGYAEDELSRAKAAFASLSPAERQAYRQKAYTLIYAKTGSHERALARCQAGALLLFMRDKGSKDNNPHPPPRVSP